MKTSKFYQIIILISIFVFISFSSNAITYYVSLSGNNSNPGTSTSPWRNINYAISKATPGTTISVGPGIYNEAVNINKSGSASGGYIILEASVGAIIDGTGIGVDYLIRISNQQYVKVLGFEVRNLKKSGTPMGISIDGIGSYIEIRNNKVHHIENTNDNAHGIAVYGRSATPISNIIIDSNEIYACKLGQSESMVLNGNVTNFIVSKNVIHDNDNIGIDFIGFEGNAPTGYDQARNGICVDNRVYNISSATNPAYGGERAADGIYVDGGKDIIIERNIVDNCDIAFEIASEHQGKSTSNITVRNNFASRSYQGNIMAGGYASNKGNATNVIIVNNTTYQSSDAEIILQYNCNGVTIKNNILYAKSGNSYLANAGGNNTNVSVDNNLYFGGSTSSPGAWADAHARYANPKLVSPPANLHLQTGSPAINMGVSLASAIIGSVDVDGEPRVSNSAVDIGADEIGGVVGTVPAAPSSLAATTISATQINLTWTDNSNNEANFKIEQSNNSGATWTLVATTTANTNSYSNTGLVPATTYQYRVLAINSIGSSSYSNIASTTTFSNPTPPAAPGNLVATAISSSQINLTWVDNANNENGYRIERSTDVGSTWSLLANVGSNITVYSNPGLSNATTYYYRVRAENATGNSGFSNTAQATTQGSGGSTAIVVDGNASDWAGVPALSAIGAGGLTVLKATNDATYLYFLVQGTAISTNYILFINSDNNNSTGYASLWSPEGSDFNIENGILYKHSGSSSTWGWTAVSGASVKSVKNSSVIEIRVDRSNLVGLANTIGLGMDVENSSWSTVATIPSSGSAMCYFTLKAATSAKLITQTEKPGSLTDLNLSNYPNPFNGITNISYNLTNTNEVKLTIHDSHGDLLQTLVDGPQEAGNYTYTFDASHLRTGTYYARLASGNAIKTIKIIFVK